MSPLIVAVGPLLAASVVHGTAVGTSVQPVVLSIESPYPLEETVARLTEALAAHDFRRIPERNVSHGLGDRPRQNSRVLNFCNFRMLDEALAADPRVASLAPCRMTVTEAGGIVTVTAVNPTLVGQSSKTPLLTDLCARLGEAYRAVMEEATR